jgi:hypothetical protein
MKTRFARWDALKRSPYNLRTPYNYSRGDFVRVGWF